MIRTALAAQTIGIPIGCGGLAHRAEQSKSCIWLFSGAFFSRHHEIENHPLRVDWAIERLLCFGGVPFR